MKMTSTRNRIGVLALQGMLLLCLLLPGTAFAVGGTTNSPTPADTSTQGGATPTDTSGQGGNTAFVPLTHLPQIQALSQSTGFVTFVNTFYKILIGVGSVLAVIMIMVAGVQFMTSRGSVTSNEKAKSRIQNAIFGLILILAPTIVFGIINPDILQLNLGNEFSGLKQDTTLNQQNFATPPSTGGTANSYLLASYVIFTNDTSKASCYVSHVHSFSAQADCQSAQSADQAAFGTKDGWTRGTITDVKACDLADPSGFSLTVPGNVPQCTN